jgi:hypothetical protein
MAADKVGVIIGTLFLARDLAHIGHLKTHSYAQHKALDDFYNGIIDLADTLTEAYQGRYRRLIDIQLSANEGDEAIVDKLDAQRDWLHSYRYEAIPKDETALHNIIDEIEGLYMSTVYKLHFLS